METITTLTVSPQGQITIPKSWRELLNLNKKTKLIAQVVNLERDKELILRPLPKKWSRYMAGLGKEIWEKIDVDEYIQKERDSWDRKWDQK